MTTVNHTDPGFTGSVFVGSGVLDFVDGAAEPDFDIDPGVLEAAGFSVDDVTDELNSLTVAELKVDAAERGIDLGNATRKADIIAAIQQAG